MATAAPGFNPAYILDPSLYGDQQAIAQQQALANALMTEGITPMQGTQMAGQVALRNSPTQSMAKIAALLSGQSIQKQSNQANQELMQRQAAAMAQMFGMGAPDASGQAGQPPGQTGQGLPQGMPSGSASPAGSLGLPGMSPMQSLMSYGANPDKYMESFLKGYTPNDTTISARQGGVDPVVANRLKLIKESTDPKILAMQQAGMSPELIYKAVFGEAAKNSEFDRKPGNFYKNPLTGEAGMVGKIPEGANVQGPPGPNGQVSLSPMPNNAAVLSQNSAATTAGTNSQTPETGYVNNQPVNTTRGARVSAAVQASRDAESLKIIDKEIADATDPTEKATLGRVRERLLKTTPSLAIAPEQAPGVVPGANDAQTQLGKRFGELRDTVATAQTTNSYLDEIKQLSERAATGKFSDRLDFANAMLAPFNQKANDAKSANDLLNKYSNQIVSRLSTGGLGTDAARTILGSAYPNAHMTKDAIAEAVDNIKSVNEMQKAKLTLLSPHGNARDATAYQQKEAEFDKAADPRVWQYAGIQDPAKRKAFLQNVLKTDPTFLQKAAKLHELGAI